MNLCLMGNVSPEKQNHKNQVINKQTKQRYSKRQHGPKPVISKPITLAFVHLFLVTDHKGVGKRLFNIISK